MTTYQASRVKVRNIPWRRVLLAVLSLIFAVRLVTALATECPTEDSSNCSFHQEVGPDWTDITMFGHYVRIYWPHFDQEVR